MSKVDKTNRDADMTITVNGHEVEMQFAEKPNPQIALQIKQVLLGSYLVTGSKQA